MGSRKESESVMVTEGEKAGCTLYKKNKGNKKMKRGKAPGACVTDQWSRGGSQEERSPANKWMIAGFEL